MKNWHKITAAFFMLGAIAATANIFASKLGFSNSVLKNSEEKAKFTLPNTASPLANVSDNQALSLKEIPFNICSESPNWLRPTEAEHSTKLKSMKRYASSTKDSSNYMRRLFSSKVFSFTMYGLSSRYDFYYLSGLWTYPEDDVWKCYKPKGVITKINSGQLADIWLFEHKIKKISWQNNRYLMVVEPTQKGVQFLQFPRIENQSSLPLKVITPQGEELPIEKSS
jgi:hypothetical protein